MSLTDEQWRERVQRCYLEEGTDPSDLSENELVPVGLRLDQNGATPLSEGDVEESARRAAQWLAGGT